MTTSSSSSRQQFDSFMSKMDKIFTEYLVKKAPVLPSKVREVLVKIMPYLVIVGLIFSIPAILAIFSINAFIAPVSLFAGLRFGFGHYFNLVFLAATVVIEIMALPGLFANKASAWKLVYYAALINAVYNLLSFNLGGLIIGTLLSLYFLYQIKSYYK